MAEDNEPLVYGLRTSEQKANLAANAPRPESDEGSSWLRWFGRREKAEPDTKPREKKKSRADRLESKSIWERIGWKGESKTKEAGRATLGDSSIILTEEPEVTVVGGELQGPAASSPIRQSRPARPANEAGRAVTSPGNTVHRSTPIRIDAVEDFNFSGLIQNPFAVRRASVGRDVGVAPTLYQEQPVVPPPPAADPPPAPRNEPVEISLPVKTGDSTGKINLSMQGQRISLVVREAPINVILGLIAEQNGLNIVMSENVNGLVSVTLTDVSLSAALDAILRVNGYTWTRQGDIIVVTRLAADTLASPGSQGRILRVFDLNFLAAADVDSVAQGLLSPVGKSFVLQTNPQDKLRTKEQLIVEDLPDYVARIEDYVRQADRAPRQVLIEAHVLQVELQDDTKHGVDIQQLLARVDNARITLQTVGFTNPSASPAFFLGIDGTDLDVLVEALKSTTDSKTLASPKVLVVNGQEARIQIGAQLGFLVTTTTQTSTLQQVEFLDVGVVLRVTPQITEDHRILMSVKPEVSTGQINPMTGLPEEETTEVETTVMLGDGHGMVIGGLIQEVDTENQQKIPIVGDLWLVGRLFQRRHVVRSRSEIIIALVPRLVPYTPGYSAQDETELARATSPLLGPHLERIDRRPVEPELPDAIRNPRIIDIHRIPDFFWNLSDPYPHPVEYYFPSADGDFQLQGPIPRQPEVIPGGSVYDWCPPEAPPSAPPYPPPSP